MMCKQCGFEIPKGHGTCPLCSPRKPAPQAGTERKEGLLNRIVEWFIQRLLHGGAIKIKSSLSQGEPVVSQRVFNCWEDVPPELKAKFAQVRSEGDTRIEFGGGAAGQCQTFHSWDDVPPELKAKIPHELREQIAAKMEGALQHAGQPDVGHDGVLVREAKISKVLDVKVDHASFGE